jgi:hypothetical protein
MADPSLFQEYMNSRKLKTPAFNFVPGVGFKPTEQTQQVVNLLNQTSGKQFNLQPANSVMALEGNPMWGTGGGVVFNELGARNTGYVDPLASTVHTVAHEGAHAVLPSSLKQHNLRTIDAFAANPSAFNGIAPGLIPRDTGQRLRWAHETFGKPSIVEEAHAQGVAKSALEKLGIPYEESASEFTHPLQYPSTFVTKGIETYDKAETGPWSPYETREVERIFKAAPDLMQRVFRQGQGLIR